MGKTLSSAMDAQSILGVFSITFEGGPLNNSNLQGTGPSGLQIGMLNLLVETSLTIRHTATFGSGTSGLGLSTSPFPNDANPIAASDAFNTSAIRLTQASPDRVYNTVLPAGTYFVGVFAGGGSFLNSSTLEIDGEPS